LSPPSDASPGCHRAGGSRQATTYLVSALLALATLVGAASAASAATGGSQGAGPNLAPVLRAAGCVAVAGHPCIDPFWLEPGSGVRITGRNISAVSQVVFYGRRGPRDDTIAPAQASGRSSVTATIPAGARNGPIAVGKADGVRSKRWAGIVIQGPSLPPPMPRQTGPAPAFGTRIAARKVFYGGHKAIFSFRVASSQPVDIVVNLIRVADGTLVQSWQRPQVPAGPVQQVVWDGRSQGLPQPEGVYAFQALTATATGAQTTGASTPEQDSFALYGHMFPIRGRHQIATGAGRFGAGRRGHTHQGQDVFASCGTPLVAARAGKVVFSGYHSLAGYYLVIHGSGSGLDYMYAHLRQPALVSRGARVLTGQPIGEVGETGDAVGCHLHIELWSAPGWYKGGKPFDPLPDLQRWDGVS
jgi:murein DD-endopeptidase MepM/ murein hydrolase activator NlpD